jgi:glutathione S-transferase
MASFEIVDLATARAARGVRMVVSEHVPSPWSEAAKGMFRIQGVPVLAVHFARDDAALAAWARADNVPVVLYEDDPPRTGWAAITALAERLGPPGALLLEDVEARAAVMGLVHELAGEDGVGWSARLLMIHASLASNGARGFPLPVAKHLGRRYGYAKERLDAARARIVSVLRALRDRLVARGGDYFDGDRLTALDVYCATFLTPLGPIGEADCPQLQPMLRRAFATAYEDLGAEVPPELFAHRRRMFERHLAWPITL